MKPGLARLLARLARRWPAPPPPPAPAEEIAPLPRIALRSPTRRVGDAVYGYGLTERWRASAQPLLTSAAGASQVVLHTVSIPGMPAATHPHVLVDARNLLLDPARLGVRDELRHRPGYLRVRGGYLDWTSGALVADGVFAGGRLDQELLPRDHLRDVLGSLVTGALPAPQLVIDEPVLCIAREPREHTNPFHATTDLLNAFMAVHVLGFDPGDTRLLLLDPHPPGSLDVAFRRTFSRGHPLLRVRELPGRVLLRRAVLITPGYGAFLWARQRDRDGGSGPVGLLADFGDFVRRAFGVPASPRDPRAPVAVRVVMRRPYAGSLHGGFLRGRFADEAALLRALRELRDVAVEPIDFAALPFADQVRAAAETELLVGAHGAGLVHLLWARENARAVEIVAAPERSTYRLFPNLGEWAGRPVIRLEARERLGLRGTYLDPALPELAGLVERLADEVRRARGGRDS